MPEALASALAELTRHDIGCCFQSEPLSRYSRWRIGGPADLLVEPSTIAQVQCALKAVRKLGLPCVTIGNGSNLLFDDEGVRGVVLKIGRLLSTVSIRGTLVTVDAGIFVPRLVRQLAKAGLSGLEHAIGIPGTLGGLIVMNGGSMQRSIGTNIERVWAVTPEGTIVEYSSNYCRFSYRSSAFQNAGNVVVRADIRTSLGNKQSMHSEMLQTLRARRKKFPLKQPNCGSVFVSDPILYASAGPPGQMIESCGLKGVAIGDAMISERHANFIVNRGKARSEDVLNLIKLIRKTVQQRTGVLLSAEVQYVSQEAKLMPAHEMSLERTNE